MNKYSYPLLFVACAALSLSACKPRLTPDPYSSGGLDFTHYVAVGNSLTAGYADGSLYRSGQMSAYPSILSYSFSRLGPSDYKAALLPGESGWPIIPASGYNPKRVLGLSADCQGTTSLGPVLYTGVADTAGSSTNVAAQGPYNNLGVPGIRAVDFLNPFYALFNPYAGRLFSQPNPLVKLAGCRPLSLLRGSGIMTCLPTQLRAAPARAAGDRHLSQQTRMPYPVRRCLPLRWTLC